MLRFWHVCLLVLIALIWKVRPTYSDVDICNLSDVGMYCQCQDLPHSKLEITCFIYGNVSSTDSVWASFARMRNIVALTLRPYQSGRLNFIPEDTLKHLDALETLIIQEASVGRLKAEAISNLPSLYDVRIERNEIVTLDRYAISNLPKLKKLALSENALTEILADTFSGLDELEQLYLDQNNISRIENCGFCSLHNLRELELPRNSLMDLTEHVFRGLRFLSRLDLSYNKLRILNDKVFQAMPKLTSLNLEDNHIDYISQRAFYGLDELRELKLNNNQLKYLPDYAFSPMPELLALYLSNNLLETISSKVVESLHRILKEHFMLLFRENPLKCSCDLTWISRYLEKSKSIHVKRELKGVECENKEGEKVLAHETKPKDCEDAKSKNKENTGRSISGSTTQTPTFGSISKESTQTNIKHLSEYKDSSAQVNRTLQKTEYAADEDDNNAGNDIHVNIAVPFAIVLASIFALLDL